MSEGKRVVVGEVTNHSVTRSLLKSAARWLGFVEAAPLDPAVLAVKDLPCILESCTNLVLKEVCPKTGQPKAACSHECFRAWRKQSYTVDFISTGPLQPATSPTPALPQARETGPVFPTGLPKEFRAELKSAASSTPLDSTFNLPTDSPTLVTPTRCTGKES
mmetsp:Transcript_29413/g.69939  ORF Transcript_29413/g.69939 Transcript_29413/m.69939 type:complete len:162 (-) Transcript_29413:407-892(-)